MTTLANTLAFRPVVYLLLRTLGSDRVGSDRVVLQVEGREGAIRLKRGRHPLRTLGSDKIDPQVEGCEGAIRLKRSRHTLRTSRLF